MSDTADLVAMRLDVDEVDYHNDPCDVPSLSSSMAKVLLAKSPLHAWHGHPKLGRGERKEKDHYDIGHLMHKLMLGKGRQIVVIDADDYRTKAAREQRDLARAEHKIPALRATYDNAVAAARVVTGRLGKMGIVLRGESEIPLAWQELSGRGPIWCRAMLDHVVTEGKFATIYDFKTCSSAHPKACAAHIVKYGYDVQAAAYTSAWTRWAPQYAGRTGFVFLFAETDAPYAVTPGDIDGILREHGERGWERAIQSFADNSLEPGEWPGYTNRIIRFEAPPWLLANQEYDNDA